jgi:hypothetical protein
MPNLRKRLNHADADRRRESVRALGRFGKGGAVNGWRRSLRAEVRLTPTLVAQADVTCRRLAELPYAPRCGGPESR